MEARTAADYTQGEGYAFYSNDGFSWIPPWVAGLYALTCQVKPDVTPEEFWLTALETSDTLTVPIPTAQSVAAGTAGENVAFKHVIDPVRLIDALQKS